MRVRDIDDEEGHRLLRIIRRGTGSVVTWRRAQMVLLSAQGMSVDKIATVTFTSPDRVRDVIRGGVGSGVAGPQSARHGLAGVREETQQRMKAEAALVSGRGLFLYTSGR